MGEKANIPSDELAAAAGGISGQLGSVGGAVRDSVIGRAVDGAVDRTRRDGSTDEPSKDT